MQSLTALDQALDQICCSGLSLWDIMKDEDGNVDFSSAVFDGVEEYLDVAVELPSITLTYSLDYNAALPDVSITYDRAQVKNVRDLLQVIGEFYDSPLTASQLAMLRVIDPSSEACASDEANNAVYNALINSQGMRTGIECIQHVDDTNYVVVLDYSN